MPEKIIGNFSIKRIEILNESGEVDEALMPALSDDEIKKMYEIFILCRTFDQTALHLQREGRLGTYAAILGQEASQIGSALALEKGDWVFPSFRESGVYVAMGYPLEMVFQYWAGDERGMKAPPDLNIFPISIPVGTHIPHAAGAALAAKYQGDSAAVVAYFGDGGTSKGDFHEGFNLAGVLKLPVVFICQNNHWAISVPVQRQTASETLAQKALAYGFEGVQVDGNDIFAVYKVTRDALDKARAGGGPTFIECFTYRMSDHTTADDASRYRTKEAVDLWKPKDPLLRLRLFMEKKGLLSGAYAQEVEERSRRIVDEAVKKAEAIPPSDPKDIFLYSAAEATPRQQREMGEI